MQTPEPVSRQTRGPLFLPPGSEKPLRISRIQRDQSTGGTKHPGASTAGEGGGHYSEGCKDVRAEIGSSQGRNLALTVLYVPHSFITSTVKSRHSRSF